MRTPKLLALAAAISLTGTTASFAATFDFAEIADDYWALSSPSREPDWATIKLFDQTSNSNDYFIDGGVELTNVTATFNGVASTDVYGFFDHDSGANTAAGLGVCHNGFNGAGESLCSTNVGPHQGDDNVTKNEAMTLIFDQTVEILDMSFFNGSHHPANGWIEIGGVEYELETGKIKAGQAALAASKSFDFAYADSRTSGATQFYMTAMSVAPVPIPASMLLLGGALAGFGAMRRKKRAA